jgi:predicted metalloendopeptidase
MDDATRAAALGKLDQIHDKVGYPDRWRVYDFPVARNDYGGNSLAADAFDLHRRLARVGKPVDRSEWGMTPPTVNAYYDPSLNEIVLPAGELQPPFFSRDFYTPVNIGDEGANTIGHELTHASSTARGTSATGGRKERRRSSPKPPSACRTSIPPTTRSPA